jgi:drug/metabolite transporter (DMT)-like permease
VLRKALGSRVSALAVVFWVALGQLPVVLLWAGDSGGGPITLRYLGIAGASVGLNVLANTAFVVALARSPISVTVPLLSLIPAVTVGFAWPMLGERPALLQLVGIALVVLGALLLGSERAVAPGHTGNALALWWRSLRQQSGALLMLVVVVCWALTLPLDKLGIELVGPARHGVALSGGVALGTLLLLVAQQVQRRRGVVVATTPAAPPARDRATLPLMLGAMAVAAAGLVLQLLAIQAVLVGVVEAVKRAIGNVGALGMGALAFGEPIGWRKGVALALLVGGVMLVLLPR